MPTSDSDLDKKKDAVQALREKVAAEERKQYELAADVANDVTAAALDDEQASLQAQLDALKARNTKTAVKQGAAAVIDPDKVAAQQEAAKSEGQLTDSAAVASEKGVNQ